VAEQTLSLPKTLGVHKEFEKAFRPGVAEKKNTERMRLRKSSGAFIFSGIFMTAHLEGDSPRKNRVTLDGL